MTHGLLSPGLGHRPKKLMAFEGVYEDGSMAIVRASRRGGFLRDIAIDWGDVRRQWQR